MVSFFFYFFAATMIFASLAVVFARNPLYNVLSLVVAIFSLSSLFIILEAFFVGIILLLVYAGAVLIFFLFIVMCLNLQTEAAIALRKNHFRPLGWLAGFFFLSEFYWVIKSAAQAHAMEPSTLRGTIENIGLILFTDYLLPFELTSLLLLIAIFGIVSLATGAFSPSKEGNK